MQRSAHTTTKANRFTSDSPGSISLKVMFQINQVSKFEF